MEEQNKVLRYKELTPEEKVIQSVLYENKNPQEWGRFGPKGYTFLKDFGKYAPGIYNMELKDGDIFVVCYQRSGGQIDVPSIKTHIIFKEQHGPKNWTVWLLSNNLNYEVAKTVPLARRYPFLEQVCFFNEDARTKIVELSGNNERVSQVMAYLGTPGSRIAAAMPSPRFIKSHLPLSLLPPKILDTAKVVYVARDPRDVAVSSYHHAKLFKPLQFKGSFKELWNAFTKDLFTLNPYFEHVKEAWALRDHPNMLFIFYEDMTKDLPASIRRVADFLGKELTQEQIDGLCDYLSFDTFKNNKSVNYEDVRPLGFLDSNESFIRKGKAGGWREYFDAEMASDAERWIADNLKDTDLRFPSVDV